MYINAVLTGAVLAAFVLPFAASAPIQTDVEARIVEDVKPLYTRNLERRDDDVFYPGGGYKRGDDEFYSGGWK